MHFIVWYDKPLKMLQAIHVETVFGQDFTLQKIYISDIRRGRRSTVGPI